eukprot:Em0003g887a
MDSDGGHVLQGEKDQEECAVPCFRNTDKIDFPTCPDGSFVDLLQSFKDLVKSTPGKTTLTHHLIPTTGYPLKVPPRRVPAEYRAEVEDEVQDRLCGCTIFSTLDLRLMDKVLRGLNFVTTYLDDVLVHSKTKDEHIKHLNVVFSRLKNAGLTLRGSKCHIGHDKVYYLGHVFSEQAQKMEGLLCRWALALQEYDFVVQYRKGSQNSNADALSRLPSCTVSATIAVVGVWEDRAALRLAQEQDPVLRKVIEALKTSRSKPSSWSEQPLRRYAQLWQQLVVTAVDGIACRRYSPGPCDDVIEVPLIPETLRKQALQSCHDVPIASAGHQGAEKTLARLRQEVFWVNMARDVEEYCRNCVVCQRTKLLMPVRAPMQNVPIGRTWQMIAVDHIQKWPIHRRSSCFLFQIEF